MTHRILFLLLLWGVGLAANIHAAPAPHVVFMIGEDEYKTWETLPAFAKSELAPPSYRVTIVEAAPNEKNDFPGLTAALRDADLLVVSVRRRTPRPEQLAAIKAHLQTGKPLVGIRTASHAFALRPKDKLAPDSPWGTWQNFDPEVFGGNYTGHHGSGPKTSIRAAPEAEAHPILRGIKLSELVGQGSLYKVSPLRAGTEPLLIGTIPQAPDEPVAWVYRYGPKSARVFYTSLGHPDDFAQAEFRELLRNAIDWGLGAR